MGVLDNLIGKAGQQDHGRKEFPVSESMLDGCANELTPAADLTGTVSVLPSFNHFDNDVDTELGDTNGR